MTKKELNNLIKEELEAAIKGHPSYLEEAEDMEPGEMEGGEEGEDDIMDSLQDFYEKLKAHFEAGGEEKTKEEEEEMEEEEDAEEMEEGKKRKAKEKEEKEKEEVDEIALNESVKRFKKLANING